MVPFRDFRTFRCCQCHGCVLLREAIFSDLLPSTAALLGAENRIDFS